MRPTFLLDQHACIGCHACTVACKAENDVPLGAFRTWVKWVEHGSYPETTKSAAVLRCNHCDDAPCVTICPTKALHKRADGIVDLDDDRCIGCASCIQACPYDAIHIDHRVGTAAKCHFCAHRLEVGLAPACVSVCPEQAIKVLDRDDPATDDLLAAHGATLRKEERKTIPRTYYVGADPATLDPLAVDGARTLSHSEVPDPMPSHQTLAAKAVYDVPRERYWGSAIAGYLVTKAVAAGALLLAGATQYNPRLGESVAANLGLDGAGLFGLISVVFVTLTAFLLVADLHKPMRFWFLLAKPNTKSWLVIGGWILMAHGGLSVVWIAGQWLPWLRADWLAWISFSIATMTAVYTAFLFRQARGRELWSEDATLPLVLIVQMGVAAVAVGWLVADVAPISGWIAIATFLATMTLATVWPQRTEHARRAHRWMVRRPLYLAGFVLSALALAWPPIVLLAFFAFDSAYVQAGQEVPLS